MSLKYALLLLAHFFGTCLFSQTTFFYDTYHPDNNSQHEIFDTTAMENDTVFDLRIEGTYSVWGTSTWKQPCGDIETAPMYPSSSGDMTGHVGFDAEYMYSLPDLERCESNEIPISIVRIEITLDNGETWFHPTTDDPYNPEHAYVYSGLVGEGYPIGIRQTSAMTFDDYGQLLLSMKKVTNTTSVADLATEDETYIYPNPSTGIFTIENIKKGSRIEVYNSTGVLLNKTYSKNKGKEKIDLSNFVSGVYFVKIDNKVHKIILVQARA